VANSVPEPARNRTESAPEFGFGARPRTRTGPAGQPTTRSGSLEPVQSRTSSTITPSAACVSW